MGAIISIIGSNHDSDEYQAALMLKNIIKRSLPEEVIGEIVLFSSATLIGQEVKDIDLLMLGILQNYSPKLNFNNAAGENVYEKVEINSFCTTIEIKSHDISGIFREGTDFYVKYGLKNHCVTEQSNKQKFSAMNFFNKTLSSSPYVTNVIWFTGASEAEIKSLLMEGDKEMPSNVLGHDFDFKEMMQLLVWQKKPYKTGYVYRLDSNYGNCTIETLKNSINLFSKVKEGMGELTRKRIEQIAMQNLKDKNLLNGDNVISIYRGRAGTGKTVGLIQTAIKLVDEDQSRVLILTYNKALVSDIRRLFALAELPDMFEQSCVQISTMQSYFYNLINISLYDGKLDGEKYLHEYESLLSEMISLIKDEKDGADYLKEIMRDNYMLDWDYVLIDEAQDWTDAERDLILSLFEKGHVLVADGGQQFVRKINACDWTIVHDRKNIKLKYCLRQKNNIISFLNKFQDRYGGSGNKIIPCGKMTGGKVIIITGDYLESGVHEREIERLKNSGNINYDMLYLVPPHMAEHTEGGSHFRYVNQFEQKGIYIWDGTNEKNRYIYSVDPDEVRLLQYESSRGLEGWTVVCLEFDEFMSVKEGQYNPERESDALLLESPEAKKQKYLLNWAMIPLTRAIDTLVIGLKDENSHIGQILKEIAVECEDYVIWM